MLLSFPAVGFAQPKENEKVLAAEEVEEKEGDKEQPPLELLPPLDAVAPKSSSEGAATARPKRTGVIKEKGVELDLSTGIEVEIGGKSVGVLDEEILEDDAVTIQAPERVIVEEVVAPLNDIEQQMLERVKEGIRDRVLARHRIFPEESLGPKEIRICTLDMDGYGLKKDAVRYGRKTSSARLRQRTQDIAVALAENDCGVTAMQGLLGKEQLQVIQALERLAEETNAAREELGKRPTRFFPVTGETNDKGSYSGFFIDTGQVEHIDTIYFHDRELERFEISSLDTFYRGPVAVKVSVPGKAGAVSRRLHFSTAALGGPFRMRRIPPREQYLQLYETWRKILVEEAAKADKEDIPIFVSAVAFNHSISNSFVHLLEGTVRLRELRGVPRCTLTINKSLTCENRRLYPQMLFGLFSTDLFRANVAEEVRAFRMERLTEDERERRVYRRWATYKMQTDLYMFQLKVCECWVSPIRRSGNGDNHH